MSIEDKIGQAEHATSNIFKRTVEHGLFRTATAIASIGIGGYLGYNLLSGPYDPFYVSAAASFVGASVTYLASKLVISIPDHIYTMYQDVKDVLSVFSKKAEPAH